MSYSEDETETFYHFSETEAETIETKLKELGYRWDTNTPCGNCCGMFADEYWVNGIGGKFKQADKEKMYQHLKALKIACSIGGYTISADPSAENDYQIDT